MSEGDLTSDQADRLAARALLCAFAWPVLIGVFTIRAFGLSGPASIVLGVLVGVAGSIAAIRLGGRVRRSQQPRGLASVAYALGWIEIVLSILAVLAIAVLAYAWSRSDWTF